MSRAWIHENPAHWDDRKSELFTSVPEGIFDIGQHEQGALIPGDWWRVEEDGTILGYGWMDCTWGDAEILLVVDANCQRKGVGSFILDRLECEAAEHGLNYVYNVVPATHPDRDALEKWLRERRFESSHDAERLMRRVHPEQQNR